MSPSEVQELRDFEPFVPLRLVLASGDVVKLYSREGLSITDLSLVVVDTGVMGRPRMRLVSIPNICLAEPLPARGNGDNGDRLEGESE